MLGRKLLVLCAFMKVSNEMFFDWFGNPIEVPQQPTQSNPNPCIAVYGNGPEGQTCKGCVHLRYPIQRNPKAKFWKCDKRKLTHGPKTDHRVNWPACAKYEKREGEYHGG